MTDHEITVIIVAGLFAALLCIIYGAGWVLLGCPRWFMACSCREPIDPGLVGRAMAAAMSEPERQDPPGLTAAVAEASQWLGAEPDERWLMEADGPVRWGPGSLHDVDTLAWHVEAPRFTTSTAAQVWEWLGCDPDGRPMPGRARPLAEVTWAPWAMRAVVGR